jgi:lysozyme
MSNIKGIDVSNNDGSIDFSKVVNDSVQYVYLKATEGQSFQDNYMDSFYNDCKSNGLKVGAYHFLVGTSTPEVQVQNFYDKIKDYEWDLVPMMDIETNFDGLSDYVTRFISAFKVLCPLELGIYSYTSFVDYLSDISDVIKNMKFWEANYNNDPWNVPSNFFTNRIGHQFTETGSINGVDTNCDVNSFTTGVLASKTTISGTWIIKNGKWWYEHTDGSYTSNGWEKIDGSWYYFDSEGWMAYDWKKAGNNWYYLGNSNDGSMKSGWLLKDSKWYYLGKISDGAMKTGWQKIDGNWYYFDASGAMQTGWIKDNNKDYCLYSDGSMMCNCTNYGYSFAPDGVATKLS